MAKFNLPVPFEKDPQAPVRLSVILADGQGNILQQSPVNEKGIASFDNEGIQRGNLQVVILPNVEDQVEGLKNIQQLARFKPFIPALDWKDGKTPIIQPIPPVFADWWNIRFCRVLGRLTKNYNLNNVQVALPVCRARVHICEVDKIFWLIRKIPDYIIKKIPELVVVQPEVIRPPVPDPAPFAVRPGLLHPVSRITVIKNREPVVKIDPAIAAKLNTTNLQVLRTEIANNISVLRPHFCKLPWLWPYFYRCDAIKTVYTDENGRFDTSIIYFSEGDKPDIYIWAECLIDGVWTTVYRPSIACNTRWDYACGTDIAVNITDERVTPGCGAGIGGESIWIRSIGNYSVRDVLQVSSSTVIQGVPFERKGLFKYGTDHRSPFATTSQSARFNLGVVFGSGLPVNGAKYFRWAYRKIANEVLVPQSGTTRYLTDEIKRPYLVEQGTGAVKYFQVKSADLGPVTVGPASGLYHIPPADPVGFQGITSSVGWMSMTVTTTSLDTRTMDGDGLYEFWIEVFNAAGNRVNLPQVFFQIPRANDFMTSETASGDYFDVMDGMNAFKMVMRIDSLNNGTVAEIYPVKLTGAGGSFVLSNACGFLDYTDAHSKNISIPFKAYQPNHFADFSFFVGRGNAGSGAFPTAASISGMVIGDAGRYVRDVNGVYAPDDVPDLEFSPSELMQTCATGGRAAFTAALNVWALHTDGYRRLHELDSGANAAFALSQKP